MRRLVLALAGIALVAASPAPSAVYDPAAAIALAVANPRHGHVGMFRMTVASAGTKGRVTFLDSATNYRAADNVAFSLSEKVAREVEQRLGAPLQRP